MFISFLRRLLADRVLQHMIFLETLICRVPTGICDLWEFRFLIEELQMAYEEPNPDHHQSSPI